MTEKPVAIVTGASRGIGFVIASELAAAGYDLAICGTREASVKEAGKSIAEKYRVRVLAKAVNVAERDQVIAFVNETLSGFGRIDVLVNNAGITRDNLAMRLKADDWQQVIETNLSSVFHASQAVLKPMMRARFGRIINLSSVVASMGNPGQLNYCASKGGIDAMTRALAREVGSRGITVNAIAPGFIETDMTAELGEEARAKLTGQIPLGRLGKPEDIAALAVFLSSDKASYITGQVIHVNGGMYM